VCGASGVRWGSRQAGFTVAEALIAVMLIGLIATMFIPYVVQYSQRARAEGSAHEIRNFIVQAQPLMLGTSSRVTVAVRQESGRWVVTMTSDVPPAAGSPLAEMPKRFELPEYMVLDGLSLGAGDWPQQGGSYVLVCDTLGRTLDPTQAPPAMIASQRTLRFTHRRTVEGYLQPRNVWEIRVSPLWNVSVERRRVP